MRKWFEDNPFMVELSGKKVQDSIRKKYGYPLLFGSVAIISPFCLFLMSLFEHFLDVNTLSSQVFYEQWLSLNSWPMLKSSFANASRLLLMVSFLIVMLLVGKCLLESLALMRREFQFKTFESLASTKITPGQLFVGKIVRGYAKVMNFHLVVMAVSFFALLYSAESYSMGFGGLFYRSALWLTLWFLPIAPLVVGYFMSTFVRSERSATVARGFSLLAIICFTLTFIAFLAAVGTSPHLGMAPFPELLFNIFMPSLWVIELYFVKSGLSVVGALGMLVTLLPYFFSLAMFGFLGYWRSKRVMENLG